MEKTYELDVIAYAIRHKGDIMKIKCLVLAGLVLLASCGGNNPDTSGRPSQDSEYQALNYQAAQTYWSEYNWQTKILPGYYN